ncbi:helix-turn-helix domain-containing protein [Roseibium suaedae]|uniref:Helix-turn-helix domain-containing protein n=1 Tax=Roseibium suaedae TaxID=735517 RepID=A0A1M7PMM9_9HYPH|nr:helix-turn-helix transcriptional regulator [Roseibium suaedae]SHN18448.1 Helix-turn-helix domain-containing protein [Roseibium suaedae]
MKRLDRIRLGNALAKARQEMGFSIRTAAMESGVSAPTISRAERAHPDSVQNAENVLVLCDFYGLNPLSFLAQTGPDLEGRFHGNTPVKHFEGAGA